MPKAPQGPRRVVFFGDFFCTYKKSYSPLGEEDTPGGQTSSFATATPSPSNFTPSSTPFYFLIYPAGGDNHRERAIAPLPLYGAIYPRWRRKPRPPPLPAQHGRQIAAPTWCYLPRWRRTTTFLNRDFPDFQNFHNFAQCPLSPGGRQLPYMVPPTAPGGDNNHVPGVGGREAPPAENYPLPTENH